MKPRGQLMIEHRLIEKYLAQAAAKIEAMAEEAYDPVLVDTVVDFIRTYADRTHHGKEEDILFAELGKKSMRPADTEAMRELVEEHRLARERVREVVALNGVFRKGGTGARDVVPRIKEIVAWLGRFYPTHIRKEDTRFFPDTEKYFSAEELDAMVARFNEFDRAMIHEKYKALLDDLIGKERP